MSKCPPQSHGETQYCDCVIVERDDNGNIAYVERPQLERVIDDVSPEGIEARRNGKYLWVTLACAKCKGTGRVSKEQK